MSAPVSGLVLAAGGSSSLGQPKQLLPYRGTILLDWVVRTVEAAASLDHVTVVLGGAAREVRVRVTLGRAQVVEDPDFGEGCSSPYQAGLAALDPTTAAVVVVLGDQPGVQTEDIDLLVGEWRRSGARIMATSYRGERGHPLLFSRELFGHLEELHGDKAAWKILDRHPDWVHDVTVDRPIPQDVDTWQDEVGLSCGGDIEVLVEPFRPDPAWQALRDALLSQRSATLAVGLEPPALVGRKMVVFEDGATTGSIDQELHSAIAKQARGLLLEGGTRKLVLAGPGEERSVFLEAFRPPPHLFLLGAAFAAPPLARMASEAGFHVTVVDPRAAFATRSRFPTADEVIVGWPNEVVETAELGPQSYIVMLLHDPKFDVPALLPALRSEAGYIGVMGSRRTHERRLDQLRERGFGDDALARLRAPIGVASRGKGAHGDRGFHPRGDARRQTWSRRPPSHQSGERYPPRGVQDRGRPPHSSLSRAITRSGRVEHVVPPLWIRVLLATRPSVRRSLQPACSARVRRVAEQSTAPQPRAARTHNPVSSDGPRAQSRSREPIFWPHRPTRHDLSRPPGCGDIRARPPDQSRPTDRGILLSRSQPCSRGQTE